MEQVGCDAAMPLNNGKCGKPKMQESVGFLLSADNV